MNLAAANGKIFLLYKETEEKHVRKMRKCLEEHGIIAIPCEDPANFRFVTPQVIPTESAQLDLIGRLALKHLGQYSAEDKFVKSLQEELAQTRPMETGDTKQ